jgi:hypothetical protein
MPGTLGRKAAVWQESDELEVEPAELSEERGRDFEEWVRRRLSGWSSTEIWAFDRWLLDEAHFDLIPAVRKALSDRYIEAPSRFLPKEEPAA